MKTVEDILAENEETFFPWSDEEKPPLDADKNLIGEKDFVEKEKQREEDLREWASL